MNYRPKARTSDFVVQESGSDILIYDLENNKAVCLNETAAAVWKLCNGSRSVSEIAFEMRKQKKSAVDEDFVLLALDQLNKDGLLADGFEQNERFAGLSRREVIKKVGISSMVALPIVSSIVAPKAISAQSAQTCVINACIQAGDEICTGTCVGMQVANLRFSSIDGSCTNQIGSSTGQCNSRTDTGDIRITNIF